MSIHTRTPTEISEEVLNLCRSIAPEGKPQFLDVTPEPGCNVADCFENVRRKVENSGGVIQFGWALWEWPQVFIEAEHHAVYKPVGGLPYVDLTPCARNSRKRLFLPDDSATYDFENEGVRRNNVILALSEDPDIAEFIKATKRRSALYNELPGVGEISVSLSEYRKIQKSERRVKRAIDVLVAKYEG